MSDLISRSALYDYYKKRECNDCPYEFTGKCGACGVGNFLDDIKLAPTIEAEPIKHGRWERYGAITQGTHIIPIYRCSECKEDTNNWFRHYCPNCGAKMDE